MFAFYSARQCASAHELPDKFFQIGRVKHAFKVSP